MRNAVFALLLAIAVLLIPNGTVFAEPSALRVDASQLWPQKASWIGQKAVFPLAKLYASASYLLLYEQPGKAMSGVDQLALGRAIVNKPHTIEGLYSLTAAGKTQYYWRLTSLSGRPDIWVVDTAIGHSATLPFATESELAEERGRIAEVETLIGSNVWINRNMVPASELSEKIDHLEQLTITDFRSTGPFSELYSLSLRRHDGTVVHWKAGLAQKQTAYSHTQFLNLVHQCFFTTDPQAIYKWPDTVWQQIRMREIRLGMSKEMVLLSWGAPEKQEKGVLSTETWRYQGKYYLTVTKGILTSIKTTNPKPVSPGNTVAGKNATDKLIPITSATITEK